MSALSEGEGYRNSVPLPFDHSTASLDTKERNMPIILWLLGVPLSLILVLWLFGVVHF